MTQNLKDEVAVLMAHRSRSSPQENGKDFNQRINEMMERLAAHPLYADDLIVWQVEVRFIEPLVCDEYYERMTSEWNFDCNRISRKTLDTGEWRWYSLIVNLNEADARRLCTLLYAEGKLAIEHNQMVVFKRVVFYGLPGMATDYEARWYAKEKRLI